MKKHYEKKLQEILKRLRPDGLPVLIFGLLCTVPQIWLEGKDMGFDLLASAVVFQSVLIIIIVEKVYRNERQ